MTGNKNEPTDGRNNVFWRGQTPASWAQIHWITADGCRRQAELLDVGGGALLERLGPWDREPTLPIEHVVVRTPGESVVIRASDWHALEQSGNDFDVFKSAIMQGFIMKKYFISITVLSLVFFTGCAAHRTNVIIDPAGVDMQKYQGDLAQCQQLAEQVESKAGKGAVGGALVLGAVGAVVGNRDTVKKAAGVGAISGGARGAVATGMERERVVKNCLRNRGYRVLN